MSRHFNKGIGMVRDAFKVGHDIKWNRDTGHQELDERKAEQNARKQEVNAQYDQINKEKGETSKTRAEERKITNIPRRVVKNIDPFEKKKMHALNEMGVYEKHRSRTV